MFGTLSGCDLISSQFVQELSHIGNIFHRYFTDLLLLFFIQSEKSIYEPPSLNFTLWYL